MDELRNKLEEYIKKDKLTISDLKGLLTPVAQYVDAPIFNKNIVSVIDIIIMDRNQDKKFNIEDLRLLGRDVFAITSLVNIIMTIVLSIPDLKFKYSQGATEELIFKILVYVFLILIPTKTGRLLTLEEKRFIIDLTMIMYQTLQTSQITQNLISNIHTNIKLNKSSCCYMPDENPEQKKLDKILPIEKLALMNHMNNIQDKTLLYGTPKKLTIEKATKTK